MATAQPIVRIALTAFAFAFAACARTELEAPSNHPGHPGARSARLLEATPLDPVDFAPTADAPEDDASHGAHRHGAPTPVPSATDSPPAGATYSCPMHPEVAGKAPGKCPICGMKLEPKKDGK